jgi:outer membrane murein-binding lipoprotein Lpp
VLRELRQQLVSAQRINGSVNDEAIAATSNGLQELNAEVAQLEAEIAKQVRMTRTSLRVEQNVVRHLWF